MYFSYFSMKTRVVGIHSFILAFFGSSNVYPSHMPQHMVLWRYNGNINTLVEKCVLSGAMLRQSLGLGAVHVPYLP